MCRQLELLKEDGRNEGRIEGERMALINSTMNLMETFDLTMNQAMDALKIPLSQRAEIEPLLVN